MHVGEGLLVAAGNVSVTGLSAGNHRCWDAGKGTAGAGLEGRDALLVPLALVVPGFGWQHRVSITRRGLIAPPGFAGVWFTYSNGNGLALQLSK